MTVNEFLNKFKTWKDDERDQIKLLLPNSLLFLNKNC